MSPIKIPRDKVRDVRFALEEEQRAKAPDQIVRYSKLHNTFWRWMRNSDGKWQQCQSSRSGKRLGTFFGKTAASCMHFDRDQWGHARYWFGGIFEPFTINLDLKDWTQPAPAGYKAWAPIEKRKWRPADPPLDVPEFIGSKGGFVGTDIKFLEGYKPVFARTGRWTAKQPETTMTPLKLSILLWRAAHPAANYCHPDGVIPQGNIRTALGALSQDGFVTLHATGYRLTDKANVFVEHLTKQPLPVPTAPQWQMPATGGVVKPV